MSGEQLLTAEQLERARQLAAEGKQIVSRLRVAAAVRMLDNARDRDQALGAAERRRDDPSA